MRWRAPLDPRCPAVRSFTSNLLENPIPEQWGAPVDDIMADFEKRHRMQCTRCREFGLANMDIAD